jgi:magnesium chelatase family protein
MLAKRIPTILPPMSLEEAIETTRIHSVAGVLEDSRGLVGTRPYRSPHHAISDAGLIRGGAIPRPGEVSLGHKGVVFPDELPEFQRNVLEVMRQPLEDGNVTIARAALSVNFPSRFMLAPAMHPCPCGFFGDTKRECHCSPVQIQRYVSKISGPLLDRIDIHIEAPAVQYKQLRGNMEIESSACVRSRVIRARELQLERCRGEKNICVNSQMPPKLIRKHCAITAEGEKILEMAIQRLGLCAHDRMLKVSRTIADLEGATSLAPKQLSEAIQYRTLDRTYWA